jgi:putative ABC transport system permease protein
MFDLENAVDRWKKAMGKSRAIQDGDLAELEAYLRDKVEDLIRQGLNEEEAFRRAEAEFAGAERLDGDFYRVHTRRWSGRPPWQTPRFVPALVWNYFKIALRKIRRQKGSAAITIGGLALAMTVCLLTILWIQYEFSYDKFHENGPDIFRIVAETRRDRSNRRDAAPIPLGPALAKTLPEVRKAVRINYGFLNERIESPQAVIFKNATCMTDPDFFTLFSFPLIQGDPRTVLSEPNSVVLSETAARRLFGNGNPVGRTLLFLDKKFPLTVSGVMKDVPKTSHLQFDFVVPIQMVDVWYKNVADWSGRWEDWSQVLCSTYLQLTPGADIPAVEAKIGRLVQENAPKADYRLSLQSLSKIHLHSADIAEGSFLQAPPLRIDQVRLFAAIAFIVLLIAAINYTNLNMARSLNRSKEIGIRKVAGASRLNIARQFLGEALVFSSLALCGALVSTVLLLPLFTSISGRDLEISLVPKIPLALSLLGLTAITAVASGLYPALVVSSFSPAKALKNRLRTSRQSFINLRRGLVAVQIVGSAVLTIVTAVILFQMRYVETKDLGYDRKNILVTGYPDQKQGSAFKSDLLRHPGILSVASGLPPTLGAEGRRMAGARISWEGKSPEADVPMDFALVDEIYLQTYRMTMAAGRFFSKEFPADLKGFVVNESAVRAMGLHDPIGKSFQLMNRTGRIIGVIKDFHIGTLRAKIAPAVFLYSPYVSVSIRLDPRNIPAAIRHIEATWKAYNPEKTFAYSFLEDDLDRLYDADRKAGRILVVFGLLSLAISGLGLFGLISFFAEQRTKEIGIRKILGASVLGLARELSAEFVVLVGGAIVAAWAVSYAIASRWLAGFAYRIPLSWWIFAGAGALVFALTLAAMGVKAFRAARANPVEALRYE